MRVNHLQCIYFGFFPLILIKKFIFNRVLPNCFSTQSTQKQKPLVMSWDDEVVISIDGNICQCYQMPCFKCLVAELYATETYFVIFRKIE
jgi:hypothetical protein